MPTSTYTETEAIAAIRAALYQHVLTAEADYNEAQRTFPVGSVERREARGILGAARVAYETARRISDNVA